MSDLNLDEQQREYKQNERDLERARDSHFNGENQTFLQRMGEKQKQLDHEASLRIAQQEQAKDKREEEQKKAEAKRGYRYTLVDLLSKARDSDLAITSLKAISLPFQTFFEGIKNGYKRGGFKIFQGAKQNENLDEIKVNTPEEEQDIDNAINESNSLDDGQALSADGDLIKIDENLDKVNPEKADTGLKAEIVELPVDEKELALNEDLNLPKDYTYVISDSPELILPNDLSKTPYVDKLDDYLGLSDEDLAKARSESDLYDSEVQDHLEKVYEQRDLKTASADNENEIQRKPNAETELASQSETVQGSALKSNPNRYVYAIPTKQAEQIQKLNEAGKITGIEVHKNLMSAMASNSNPNDITSLSQKQYEKLMKKKEALRLKELAKAKRAEKELKESMNVVLGGGRSR